MGKGWGYGKSSLSPGEILYNTSSKIVNNDSMIVYQGRILNFGYIDVKIIISKTYNTKRVKMRYEGENTLPKIYDVSHCKNKKEICQYVNDVLLSQYFNDAYNITIERSQGII